MPRRSTNFSWLRPFIWALLWIGAIAAGWFFSDYWRNLLVNAYESRRERFDALQEMSEYSASSPKLQRQIDEVASGTNHPGD